MTLKHIDAQKGTHYEGTDYHPKTDHTTSEPRPFRSNFRSVVMMGDPLSKRTISPWSSDFGATQGAIPISDQFQLSHGNYQPKQNFNCGPSDYHGGQDPSFPDPNEYPQKPKSVVARESKSYRSSSFDNHHQPGSDHFNTGATLVADEFHDFGCTQHHGR